MRASDPGSKGTRLILGLCNPGEEYEATYHNVGGIFVDHLSSALGISFKRTRYFEYARSGKLILAKSLVYMNESGSAAAAAIKYFDLPIDRLFVAHDDSDITLGNFKITIGQNAAGHHGVESTINTLGTMDFSRIRIGIRPTQEKKHKKAGELVLKQISRKDLNTLKKTFDEIREELGTADLLIGNI